MRVNGLLALQSHKPGQHLIGLIQKITRSSDRSQVFDEDSEIAFTEGGHQLNLVRAVMIGTLIDKIGKDENVFRRTLEDGPGN